MSESFLERHARNQRRLTAGRAGKPEFNIEVDITAPVLEEAVAPAEISTLFLPPQETGPDGVVRATVSQLKVGGKVRDWFRLVRDLCGEKALDIRNLWVRIDVRPESKGVTYTTNLVTVVLAYRDPTPASGRLRMFVRFVDFARVVETDMVSDFAVEGRKLLYTSGGKACSLEAPDRVDGDSFTPDAPPLSGYKMVKGLGLALREAAMFTKKKADSMGRHKVFAWPRKDATGTVDFIGCDGPLIYRREIQAPEITQGLYLEPLRALSNESVIPDSLGFFMSGNDFVWLLAETGFIIGLENEPSAVPYDNDLAQYLASPNGRIGFSDDCISSMKRAVAQIRLNPETVAEKEMVVLSRGSSLEFGTKHNIQSVPCVGDAGPIGMDVDPDAMARALAVRGVNALEFDRSDPRRPLLVVGPGVRVALNPLTVVSTIRS